MIFTALRLQGVTVTYAKYAPAAPYCASLVNGYFISFSLLGYDLGKIRRRCENRSDVAISYLSS